MSVTSAIPFLRDFGSTSGGNLEGSDGASSQLNTVGVGATEFAQQEYERGLEEGRAQAENAFNSELRAFKEQAAADLEEARTAWVSNEGAELRRQIEVGFEDLYRDLSDAASVALNR